MKTNFLFLIILLALLLGINSNAQSLSQSHKANNYDIVRYDHDTLYLIRYMGYGKINITQKIPVLNLVHGSTITESDLERSMLYKEYPLCYHVAHLPVSFLETSRIDTVFYLHYDGASISGKEFKVKNHTISWIVENGITALIFCMIWFLIFFTFECCTLPFDDVHRTIKRRFIACSLLSLLAGLIIWGLAMLIDISPEGNLLIRILFPFIITFVLFMYRYRTIPRKEESKAG